MEKTDKDLINIPSLKTRKIVLDTETTGFGGKDHIIALCAFEINNEKMNPHGFTFYVKPRVEINSYAEKVHHLTKEFLEDKANQQKPEKQIFSEFLEWVGNSPIYSHNSDFDFKFINRELDYLNLKNIDKTQFNCTIRLFKTIVTKCDPGFIQISFELSKCCEYMGILDFKRNFHDVIYDAKNTGELLINLLKLNEGKLSKVRVVDKKNKDIENNNNNEDKDKKLRDMLFKELDI